VRREFLSTTSNRWNARRHVHGNGNRHVGSCWDVRHSRACCNSHAGRAVVSSLRKTKTGRSARFVFLIIRRRLHSRRQPVMTLGLSYSVLTNLIKQCFVTDFQQSRSLFAIPVSLIQRARNRFRFGFILRAAC